MNPSTTPKLVFKYGRSKPKTKTGIADLENKDGYATRSDKDKSEVLNDFFCSVFTRKNTKNEIPKFKCRNVSQALDGFSVSLDVVIKKLEKLNAAKAPGPDSVSPSILKQCSKELVMPL